MSFEGVWWVSYAALWAIVVFQSLALFVLLREVGLAYLSRFDSSARDGFPLGKKAPVLVAEDTEGKPVHIPQEGMDPTILIFGSPTCKPCQSLMPQLVEFSQEYSDRVQLLLVSLSPIEEARVMKAQYGLSFSVVAAEQSESNGIASYRVERTPFCYVLDRNGNIRAKGLVNHADQLLALANPVLNEESSNGYR